MREELQRNTIWTQNFKCFVQFSVTGKTGQANNDLEKDILSDDRLSRIISKAESGSIDAIKQGMQKKIASIVEKLSNKVQKTEILSVWAP